MKNVKRKNSKKSEVVKIKCVAKDCGKEKAESYFFKVDSPLFPNGRINICRDCVRKQVDEDDLDSVIGFLRQIDKPFNEEVWEKAKQAKNNSIGEYIRKVNSLQQLKGKNFNDSSGMQGIGKTVDLQSAKTPDTVETVTGFITYSDDLINKWGIGYKKHEYLQLEKFYVDMKETHEINTSIHIDQLKQIAYLSVERDRLRQGGDWQNYERVSKTMELMNKSAGFRPADRQSLDDATGIRSFSQIFEEVEKRGFRKPPQLVFEEDIIDQMIISLANYYHRIVGKAILAEVPEDIKNELDEFYVEDLTPVDLDNEMYEDLDFTVDEVDELEAVNFDGYLEISEDEDEDKVEDKEDKKKSEDED